MAEQYANRSRAYGHFQADIEDFVKESEERMLAVMRASIQDVVNEAQLARGKGGRMRVDTGFLRASGQASLNGMPSGPSRPAKDAKPNQYNDGVAQTNVIVQTGQMKIGSVFYFGWSASYARYRELYDGFLEGALQNWARIVAFNTDTLRQRIKK